MTKSKEAAPSPGVRAADRKAILALDYGRARIGMAIADVEARIAQPFDTLDRENRNEDMRRLREIVRDAKVREIVVGLPLKLDGAHGEMADEATRFAERLRKQFGLPVAMVDERLTSWEAERILEEELGRRITHVEPHPGHKKPVKQSDRKYTVDAVAAMIILREYLSRADATREQS